MVSRFIPALLSLIVVFPFVLGGCSPAVDQSDLSADRSMRAPESMGQDSGNASSLEAMRRGQVPADGPLKRIYFDFDRADLRADAREILRASAEWLKANPSARAQIEGHCDERGTSEYNLALGSKRANTAKDYLVSLGVSPDRLSTVSYGEELPVCGEKTEGCWQRNRNARFPIIAAGPSS